MHILIITGGRIDPDFAVPFIQSAAWDYIICADAGLKFCKAAGILPDRIIGDFDSADPGVVNWFRERVPDRIETFPAEKDETDTELALIRALDMHPDQITVIGGTGTRLDHVLGNIMLLKKAMEAGISCALVDANNRIRMVNGHFEIRKEEQFGDYISLIPFTPAVEGLTLRGFAYEVTDFTLHNDIARGISNRIVSGQAVIDLNRGILLVIESRD